jgi:hypothetical protein
MDAKDRVEELQSINYEMLEYFGTLLVWFLFLEYCKKNQIPLPDFDKAMLFFKKSGKSLSDEMNTYSSDVKDTEF